MINKTTTNIIIGTISILYGGITYYTFNNYINDFAIKIYITKPYFIFGTSFLASILLYNKLKIISNNEQSE